MRDSYSTQNYKDGGISKNVKNIDVLLTDEEPHVRFAVEAMLVDFTQHTSGCDNVE